MKKLKRLIAVVIFLFLFPITANAFVFDIAKIVTMAAVAVNSSETQTKKWVGDPAGGLRVWAIQMTASTSGTYSNFESDWDLDGILWKAETDPGTVSPTTLYDMVAATDRGYLLFGDTGTLATPTEDGNLANRSATVTERADPASSKSQPIDGKVTVYPLNNSVASAMITLYLYIFTTEF